MPFQVSASDRSRLIRLAFVLPVGSPERRNLLRKLAEAPVEEEAAKPSSGGGGGAGRLLLMFLDEVGDQRTKNPDTGNDVYVKTLSSKPKDSKAYKLFQDQFEKWKGQLEKDKEKEKKPKAPPEAEWAGTNDSQRYEWGEEQNPIRETWPEDQREALLTYTGEAYEDINKDLRFGDGDGGYHSDTVEALDALFDSPEGKLDRAVKVSRGVGSGHPLAQMIESGEIEPGDYFEDAGYQSTSIKSDLNWGSYTLNITVPKGARAAYVGPKPDDYSEFPNEQELLLDRGTKIEVTRYDPKTKIIHARVVTE